jgi:hypothetical protein
VSDVQAGNSRCGLLKYLSSDHDPPYRFHQWQANLRILDIKEIKTVPYVPLSHPFIERLIETIRRERLDQSLFWTRADLGSTPPRTVMWAALSVFGTRNPFVRAVRYLSKAPMFSERRVSGDRPLSSDQEIRRRVQGESIITRPSVFGTALDSAASIHRNPN